MSTPSQPMKTGLDLLSLEDAARLTIAAAASLLLARLLKMPEAYWAAITAMVVIESLQSAWVVAVQRVSGTALGAAAGALLASYFGTNALIFAAGVFALGVLAALLRASRSFFRFAAITLAILLLLPRAEPAWVAALHRFIEISLGAIVAVAVAALWPETDSEAPTRT
jgi:uncharacterized membrane protein YccC